MQGLQDRMKTMIVYGLYNKNDPDKTIMYIGQTTKPLNTRLLNHKSHSKVKNYPVSKWVKSQKAIFIKALVRNAKKDIDEIRLIKKYKKINPNLLNLCEDIGTTGHRWALNKKARKNISDGHKGLKLSKAHKEAISKGNSGKKRSPETIEKMRERMKKIGPPIGGLQKGDTHSLDARKKISEAHKGKPKSAEHKEKLRLAALKRWAKVKGVQHG